jgi:SSS family solute:Na+ symporter
MAGIGAITVVGLCEAYYRSGFTYDFWRMLWYATTLIISLSGWIQYRFRETRALTMAQFLEMRYSKNFRIFAGILAFLSGTLNFGIFPAVGARFFKYFCGLPTWDVNLFGVLTIDLMYALIMLILLAISLYFTFAGGQIAVIVTDFIQGTFFNIVLLAILILFFIRFPWSDIVEAITQRPPGKSMLDPFDIGDTESFDVSYHLMQAFTAFWCFMAWLGNQGYASAARNAHEARMGRALGSWRIYSQSIIIVLLAICAYTTMHNSNWTMEAALANETLMVIQDDTIREQVTSSVVLSKILPLGLLGGFCAAMLAAFVSTHDTYLHSWGSIFIQDVVLPLRKKRLNTKEHLKLLKWSIFGVAVFIFLFSLLFSQYDAILMFFALTGILWLGGGGTVIVFGLYWKRGTTAGAYGAMIISVVAFVFSVTVQQIYGKKFPLTSMELYFIAIMISIVVYVGISLLGKRTVFNLNEMLHRGQYAIAEDETKVTDQPVRGWQTIFGMNKDFTFSDKIVYCALGGWFVIPSVIFFVLLLFKTVFGISVQGWARLWHIYVWMILGVTAVTTIWFTIGGLIDLKKMFKRLSTMARDYQDDGEIVNETGREQM